MHVELRYFAACPNWRSTRALLEQLADEFGFTIAERLVETHDEAIVLGFRGSPTVLVDGSDPFGDPESPVGLACRIYRTPDGFIGSPTEAMLRKALGA